MSTPPSPPAAVRQRDGHPGLRRLVRALSWVAVTTGLLVLVAAGGSSAYVNQQFSNVRHIPPTCLSACTGSPTELGHTENFLLVGSDTRSGANSQGALSGLGTSADSSGYGNSDTTLLVHLSADRSQVVVVSFPRDLLVTTPAYTTKAGALVAAQPNKFNAAYAAGGPGLLVKQVQQLTGLPVDHYVSIDFAGFAAMVNALHGVTVCLSVPAHDPGDPTTGSGGSGFNAPAGLDTLNGITALQYVRQRDGLPGGDLTRIQRQQRFLSAVIKKVKSAGTLLNPLKLNAFVSAVTKNVTTDRETNSDDLINLATNLRSLDPGHIAFYTVPISGEVNSSGRLGDYLSIDSAKAHALFQAVHDDQDPSKPAPAPAPSASASPSAAPSASAGPVTAPLSPSVVSLQVANGTSTVGRGDAAAAALQALGFRTSAAATLVRADEGPTEVRYGADRLQSAQTVAAAVPGAVLVPDDSQGSEGLTLVVGTSYAGTRPVTVLGAGSPSAAPPAPPTPRTTVAPNKVSVTGTDCGP